MIALFLAMVLVVLGLPAFNQLTGKVIVPDVLPFYLFYWLVGIGLLTGLLSGLYPAFFLSSFRAIQVLKGSLNHRRSGMTFRQILVVFQFATSLLLIAGTLAVFFQMDYVRQKNLGLDEENIIYAELDMGTDLQAYKTALARESSIQSVTSANQSFHLGFGTTTGIDWPGKEQENSLGITQLAVDHDFIEAFQIQIIAGRSFKDYHTDSVAYMLNEEAVKVMGLQDPLGSQISLNREEGPVVGIAKDFHFTSLHTGIKPLVIQLDPSKPLVLYVKAQGGRSQEALAAFIKVHQQLSDYPLAYHFLDETLEKMYASEKLTSSLSRMFAAMAIFISGLGLAGLVIFSTAQRTKEIGIRKVMGASVKSVLLLLSRDFIKLILVAFFIGVPVANYFISEWLQTFAYRIEIRWWFFALPGLGVLLLAILLVSRLSLKAARQNPVDSLRYE